MSVIAVIKSRDAADFEALAVLGRDMAEPNQRGDHFANILLQIFQLPEYGRDIADGTRAMTPASRPSSNAMAHVRPTQGRLM